MWVYGIDPLVYGMVVVMKVLKQDPEFRLQMFHITIFPRVEIIQE